jgi:hypothetical protein
MDSFNCQYTLCHVETSDIFREDIVSHQHCHEIATGQKLHDKIEIERILERVKQLHDPWGCRLRQDVSLRTNVSQLQNTTLNEIILR